MRIPRVLWLVLAETGRELFLRWPVRSALAITHRQAGSGRLPQTLLQSWAYECSMECAKSRLQFLQQTWTQPAQDVRPCNATFQQVLGCLHTMLGP